MAGQLFYKIMKHGTCISVCCPKQIHLRLGIYKERKTLTLVITSPTKSLRSLSQDHELTISHWAVRRYDSSKNQTEFFVVSFYKAWIQLQTCDVIYRSTFLRKKVYDMNVSITMFYINDKARHLFQVLDYVAICHDD